MKPHFFTGILESCVFGLSLNMKWWKHVCKMSTNAQKASLNTDEKKDFAQTRRQTSSSFVAGVLQRGEEQPFILSHVHGGSTLLVRVRLCLRLRVERAGFLS